jgi:hypothetical protein
MPISNAEKQARFRKKEELNKLISQVYRECQLTVTRPYLRTTSADLEAQLREAASLPSGWTDEDLKRADTRIRNIRGDILGTGDPLGGDVHDGRNGFQEFRTTPNPQKWMAEIKKAESDTIALASHLISALELSQLRNEDRAAALMEAVRHVGRALANSSSDGQSDAMAVCLTTVNPHYDRPDWFINRLANWLRSRLDDNTRNALRARLMNADGGGCFGRSSGGAFGAKGTLPYIKG